MIYLRVSTTRQAGTATDIDRDGLSIATQRADCMAKAREKHTSVLQEFIEPGKSAQSVEKRPVFREMLAYVAAQPTVGMIIVYSQSRAFRNARDFIVTREQLKMLGVRLTSTKEDYDDSPEGDFMGLITAGTDELQVRKSGIGIRNKMAFKARQGGTISIAPIGYLNTRIQVDGRMVSGVSIDAERAPLIRLAFELYATGNYTIDALYESMADHGLRTRVTNQNPAGRPMTRSTLVRVLENPYYAGFIVYDGEIYAGRHPALVDQALYDAVQEILEERSTAGNRQRTHHHYLKGLLRCDRCDQAGRTNRLMFTEAHGRGGDYQYFLCRGRQRGECDLPHPPVHLSKNGLLATSPR